MAQRMKRAAAGRRVVARSERMSDDLLVHEETAFRAIWAEFAAQENRVKHRVHEAWRLADDDPARWVSQASMKSDLLALHSATLRRTRQHLVALGQSAIEVALDSIDDELLLCERTLGKKYAGLAEDAMEMARPVAEALLDGALGEHDGYTGRVHLAFEEEMNRQVALVGMRGEDRAVSLLRLLNPEANALPGNGGRGVWWRATTGMNASARRVSIGLANQTRKAAMRSFNMLGERR